MIEANVIDAAFQVGVKKLLFLGSSCIYPKLATQPMREDALLTGALEPTNERYAIADIAGVKLCESYNRQYNVVVQRHAYQSVWPRRQTITSRIRTLYRGRGLVRRFHEALINKAPRYHLG